MKLNVFIGKTDEEKIDIFVNEERQIIEDIKNLLNGETELSGYKDSEIYKLKFSDIVLFSVESERLYAYTDKEKYMLKERLYMIEEKMPRHFIKLNQSAIGNIKYIKKFDCSVSGTLKVTFTNGKSDYVSRRQIKAVRERLGI